MSRISSITVDTEMLEEVRQRLGEMERKAPNAISNSLNRTVTNIATNVSKEVRKEYNVKATDVKDTLRKRKANHSDLSAEVRSTGQVLPLDRFKVTPKTVNPKRKKQLKVAVKKDGVKQILGAFVTNLNGIKIFIREGDDRLPIDRLFGPSVPQMLGNEGTVENINIQARDTFEKRLEHEINRILERSGGGGS